MIDREKTVEETFLHELSKHMTNEAEMNIHEIYSAFPELNRKTISWRLYSLVQKGKLYKTGRGFYSIHKNVENSFSAGYEYLQKKSKLIYDSLMEYGYDFYITGIDSLIGEFLHVPETYPVLIVMEEAGIKEIQDSLSTRDLIVITEKDRIITKQTILRKKVDAYLLIGKDFSMASDSIALKEKGFVDLYYAVTRMDYSVSVPELSRIYQSLLRNQTIAMARFKAAAKDRGIAAEINWLIQINKAPKKTLEFMLEQMKEAEWR